MWLYKVAILELKSLYYLNSMSINETKGQSIQAKQKDALGIKLVQEMLWLSLKKIKIKKYITLNCVCVCIRM